MKQTSLVPWYGSDRSVVSRYADELSSCRWVGVPYAGGLSVISRLKSATTITANDLHADLVNLAEVTSDSDGGTCLVETVERLPFHQQVFRDSQAAVSVPMPDGFRDRPASDPQRIERAAAYFVMGWMGRNGTAGEKTELSNGFSARYTSLGGDSAVRYREAVKSLREWQRLFDRVGFICTDALEFIEKCHDEPINGLYLDPPWPVGGDRYIHKFDAEHFAAVEEHLRAFEQLRVVVRCSNDDHTRDVYSSKHWTHVEVTSKSSARSDVAELMIVPNRQVSDGPLFAAC